MRSFPGATAQHMADYMKPYIWAKPNHFVIHVGTNDLNSNKPPDRQNCKNHYWFSFRIEIWKSGVSISPIIVRVEF